MRSLLPAALTFSLTVIACSPSGSEARTPTVTECGEQATPARDKVNAAIEANRTCSVDADCMTIEVRSTCFDACTTSIAKSGQAAVEQAMSSASQDECQAFAAAGCKLIIPPCMGPVPPVCREGKCS
ncbi:MAG: hypothetical protein BGO98_20965 [Myxococcales bacterium 68-20]|nr:hypothetical protein [Myxococcales bacterium]OJY28035.1 MAG: hypothetical protein BGO98_20965 [Myxococcales bacterium 68-20]